MFHHKLKKTNSSISFILYLFSFDSRHKILLVSKLRAVRSSFEESTSKTKYIDTGAAGGKKGTHMNLGFFLNLFPDSKAQHNEPVSIDTTAHHKPSWTAGSAFTVGKQVPTLKKPHTAHVM